MQARLKVFPLLLVSAIAIRCAAQTPAKQPEDKTIPAVSRTVSGSAFVLEER